jgi:O-antigen/teichoic acid export membrane protein
MKKQSDSGIVRGFGKDLIISFSGTIAAKTATIATMPLAMYFYNPDVYGTWIAILAVGGLLVPLATLRYDIPIVLVRDILDSKALTSAIAFFSIIAFCVCILMVNMFTPDQKYVFFGIGADSQELLIFAPIILLMLSLQVTQQAWATRERNFNILAQSHVVQSIIFPVVASSLALFWQARAESVVAAYILSLFGSQITLHMLGRYPRFLSVKSKEGFIQIVKALYENRVYAMLTLPSSIGSVLAERALQFFIASTFSLSVLGAFYVARQLAQAPAQLLSVSLRHVFFAYASQVDTHEQTLVRTISILRVLFAIALPALAFTLIWLENILGAFFSERWNLFPAYAWWNAIPATVLLFTAWLDRALEIFGRPKLAVMMQLSWDVVQVLILIVGFTFNSDAATIIAIYCLALTAYKLLYLLTVLVVMGAARTTLLELLQKCFLHFTICYVSLSIFANIQNTFGLILGLTILSTAVLGGLYLFKAQWVIDRLIKIKFKGSR